MQNSTHMFTLNLKAGRIRMNEKQKYATWCKIISQWVEIDVQEPCLQTLVM